MTVESITAVCITTYRPKCSAVHSVLTGEKKRRATLIGHFIMKARLDNICLVFCIKTHCFTYGFTVLVLIYSH